MEKIKVLAIDDEIEFCKAVRIGLEAAKKYEVLTASNAREGLRLARTQNPDIILLDIMMPELSGTEIAEELSDSDRTKDIPIIFVTALLKKDEEGQDYGSQDRYQVIAKPVNISNLIEQIESAVEAGDRGQS
jgi:CheY-like chemotaxis protein